MDAGSTVLHFKGTLMLDTLRSVVNDDAKWWALLYGFYQHSKYQTSGSG